MALYKHSSSEIILRSDVFELRSIRGKFELRTVWLQNHYFYYYSLLFQFKTSVLNYKILGNAHEENKILIENCENGKI